MQWGELRSQHEAGPLLFFLCLCICHSLQHSLHPLSFIPWSLVQLRLSLSIAFAIFERCLSQTPFLIVPPLISMLSLSAGGDTWMGCSTEMLFGNFDCYDNTINTIFLHYYYTPADTVLTQSGSLPSSPLQPIGIIEQPKLEGNQNNHRVEGAVWSHPCVLLVRRKFLRCLLFFTKNKGHAQAQDSSANTWTPWSCIRWILPLSVSMHISKMVMVLAELLLPLSSRSGTAETTNISLIWRWYFLCFGHMHMKTEWGPQTSPLLPYIFSF